MARDYPYSKKDPNEKQGLSDLTVLTFFSITVLICFIVALWE